MAPVVRPLRPARLLGRWVVRRLPAVWRDEVRLWARRWGSRAPRGPMPLFERALDRKVVHPDDIDWGQLRRVARSWLSMTYGLENHLEPAYWRVPKAVLAEELLRHDDGRLVDDYKFFVLNGVV